MRTLNRKLQCWQKAGLERSLRVCSPAIDRPGYARCGDRLLLNLSSNDYLGLAHHPAVVEAMRESLLTDGTGAGASRLVTGNHLRYRELEDALSAWQSNQSALVFANGYAANLGVLQALVDRNSVVFSDRLNHASIVDGIILSRAEHVRYRHRDLDHLRALLHKYRNRPRKLIVTDALFSMDGDQALLLELIGLKHEFNALLMVDEAHSGGIYGDRGEGLCHSLGIAGEVDVHMGTFSKSFGLYGAYVTSSAALTRWLINKARSLVYSTGLPPSWLAGILKALELVQSEQVRRTRLTAVSRDMRSQLGQAGFQVGTGDSPIIPVIVGDNGTALRFSAALEAEDMLVAAIRPPTVPDGTARLRLSLSAGHDERDLADAAARMIRVGRRLGVINN